MKQEIIDTLRSVVKEEIDALKETLVKERLRPMDVEDAAEFLRCSKSHIYKLIHGKKVRHFKRSKMIYFQESDLRALAFENCVNAREEMKRDASSR